MTDPMIAYCGVDCAPCADFTSGRCPGCRATLWPEGEECMPVRCCQGRGIPACGACGAFPCAQMRGFYEQSESHRAALERMNGWKEAH